MKQETIVQFVCFETTIGVEEFAAEWEGYTETLKANKTKAVLYRQAKGSQKSFSYISKFEWPESDFQFTFIKERKPGRFSEAGIRALQMGGYITIEQKEIYNVRNNDTVIIAFIHHRETDITYYHDLPFYRQLAIHQAYYENCSFGYVMEFTVPAEDAETLLGYLQKRPGVDAGLYGTSLLHKVRRLASSI
jgi:hypothetical protein